MTEFGGILAYPFRRLRRDPLEGTWHQFNYTQRNGKTFINQGTLRIRKRALGGLKGIMIDESGNLSYRGQVRREVGHIVAELKAASHDETLVLRFVGTIVARDPFMPGVWMAYDRDSNPAAGAALLCKDNASIEKARQLIGKWTTTNGPILRVAPPPK
jgi:hypothetical protein